MNQLMSKICMFTVVMYVSIYSDNNSDWERQALKIAQNIQKEANSVKGWVGNQWHRAEDSNATQRIKNSVNGLKKQFFQKEESLSCRDYFLDFIENKKQCSKNIHRDLRKESDAKTYNTMHQHWIDIIKKWDDEGLKGVSWQALVIVVSCIKSCTN